MDNELLRELTAAKEKKQLMALYRDDLPQAADYTGFPILVGKTLAVLARESDFLLDGYIAMRLEDITVLEQVDDNGFIRKLMLGEKLYDAVKAPKLTGADSWRALLDGVQSGFGGWLTVETWDGEDSCFFMGVIAHLDANYLFLHQVDADGTRHQEETTVPLQDMVTVAFGSRYIELYKKHCR